MGLDGAATYPTSVWDGDSGNRDSDAGRQAAPDYRDWARMLAEVQAVQKSNRGYDPDALNTVGVMTTKTGLSVVERGNAALHKTILTLDEVGLASTDGSTTSHGAWGTQPLYTFPIGHVIFLGAHQVYPLGLIVARDGGTAGFNDAANLEIGVGTLARGDVANFLLDTTEDNIVPGQPGVDLTTKTSDAIESSALAASLFFDGTTACVANLNYVCLADADHGTVADLLTISGTITFLWTMQGDE